MHEARSSMTVRYRAALRCARLRRERDVGRSVLDRWAWLFPRVVFVLVMSAAARLAGAEVPPPEPLRADPPTSDPFPPPREGVVVMITKTRILVDEDPTPVLELGPREALVRDGVDARYKPEGPGSLLIGPLAKRLERAAAELKTSECIVVADGSTPYQVLIEVLYTAGRSGVGTYHLMVRAKK